MRLVVLVPLLRIIWPRPVVCFWWRELDDVRQRVLLDMGFNLGVWGLMKFRKTLGHVQAHNFEHASIEMLDSKWAEQVGGRAKALSQMMRTGKDYIKSPA